MRKTTLLLNLFLFLSTAIFAQTDVSGTISSDTTWSLDNSPYNIVGETSLPKDITLTIEPGVIINYTNSYKMFIRGVLIASGTSESPITWNGNSYENSNPMLVYENANLSNSIITYNKFVGPQKGIQIGQHSQTNFKNTGILTITHSDFYKASLYTDGNATTAELKFENSNFNDLSIIGLYNGLSEPITLTNCTINNAIIQSQSQNYGIHFVNSIIKNSEMTMGCCFANLSYVGSTVYNSKVNTSTTIGPVKVLNSFFIASILDLSNIKFIAENSIFYSGNSINSLIKVGYPQISNSSFIGYDKKLSINGLTIDRDSTNITNSTFSNFNTALTIEFKGYLNIADNNFISNSLYNVKNNTTSPLKLENNYWGTNDESEIKDLLYDASDNVNKGAIDYTPFLDNYNTDAPISLPSNFTKTITDSGVELNWSANKESDVAGYRLYYGNPTGYSYSTSIDLGNVTTYTLSGGDISTEYAITAYDTSADGNDDMTDGNESWFTRASQINVAPKLSDQSVSTDEDMLVTIALNAYDPDSNNITYKVISGAPHGSIYIDKNIAGYMPYEDFNGTDSFTVVANDGKNDSEVATITITVNAVNDKPTARHHSVIVDEGGISNIVDYNYSSVLYNSRDAEDDPLTAILVEEPSHGSLVFNEDGTFDYEHDGSDTTEDYFTYKVNDGLLDSKIATVSINVDPVNDNVPTDILLSSNSIQENYNYTYSNVATFTAVDLDLPSDSHTFEFVSGEGDDDNESFTISGRYLYSNKSFDYEEQQTLSIRVKVTDANDQSFEKSFVLDVININDISLTYKLVDSYCAGAAGSGSINITSVNQSSGPITYSWSASYGGAIPAGQENNPVLTDLISGYYTVRVTDDYFTYTRSMYVNLIPQYYGLSICHVSSDDKELKKNRIYINNEGNYNVAFYDVLRETNVAGVYQSIGMISPTENSYLDETSDNTVQSYNYKVRLVDNCGSISPNSYAHKTILLQSSIAANKSINLNWSDYEGAYYTTYNIYRSTNKQAFEIIGSVSANSNSFNDATANADINNYEYYISIEVDPCSIEKSNASSEIRSNFQTIANSLSSNEYNAVKQFEIYPNPATSTLNIKLSDGVELIRGEIYNMLGQRVMETREKSFSVGNLAPATYFIKVFTLEGMTTRSFIKK
tara:strand:+ start:39040 stop:42498 length:3459 start_codon:yes stop_codon:yes gene_type:complete